MASPPPPPSQTPSSSTSAPAVRRDDNPSTPHLKQIAGTSILVGEVTGCLGVFVGAGNGILRSKPPVTMALATGAGWFILGTTYTAARSLLWRAWGGEENLSASDFVKASGMAGGVTGMIGGMLRGPKHIIPGMVVLGSLGAASSYYAQQRRKTEPKAPTSSWLDSKWSPMKRLSDQEYKEKLEERLLRLDAEIALIDESIDLLNGSKQEPATSRNKPQH